MSSVARKGAAGIGVAVAAAVFAAGPGPALAHGGHARFAHNSDKVDGIHAVKSATAKTKRRGKIVATSPTTGRLPNNIIKNAPNANKLDGLDSSVFVKTTDAIDADTFDGLASSAFVKTGDPIDADTFDGLASSAFVKTTDDIDADTLDGQDSSDFLGATAKAADSDLLDGKDSGAFVERAGTGFMLIQGDPSGWKSSGGSVTTTSALDQTTFTSTSASGSATEFVVPNLPVATYGKKLQIAEVEVCYDASSLHLIDAIRFERTVNSNGIVATTSQTLDTTDRSDEACRHYSVSNGDLTGDVTVAVSVASAWSDTGAILRLGRVTFMLEPTATDATPLS